MMKQKTTKRVVISFLAALLVLTMVCGFCMSALKESVSAVSPSSPYISLSSQNISTNKEQFYDNSVIQKLPENVKDTDTISLIVDVKQTPLLDKYQDSGLKMSFSEYAVTDEAKASRENISAIRSELLSELDKTDVEYKNGAFYSSILTGFEISIKAADFEETCKLFGDRANVIVSEVYKPAETQLVENEVNVYDTGIFDSSKFGYDGTGMVVAILDTGVDYGHSAFSLENFTADRSKLGLTYESVAALMANHEFAAEKLYSGLTASDVYVNEKIPYGFDYADYDPDVFPIKSDHGTHVSGIVAGKDDTITGVAPNAQLVEMKIFSDVQDTAIASWILTAVEDCVLLGVDVINMSIGTSCGFSRESDKEQISGVYEKVREAGISLVVAASNSFSSTYGSEKNGNLGLTSNPDTGTIGSPATYAGALSIASISGVKTPYFLHNGQIMYFIESSDKFSEEKVFLDDILPEGVDEKEFEYVTIPGVGRYSDYSGLDLNGKIALVKRGDTTFEEKANIAQEMGAAGIIIYNNVAGDIKMNVGDITIAACSLGQDDGELLAADKTGKLKISRSQTSGPFMSDFSSWGPTPDLKIKPELTAHGGSILSAVPGQGYDRISGTSMACPNISGATALLRQYVMNRFSDIKDNNVEIAKVVNSLFMSTADIVINKNGLPYAVRKQGAGLASLDKSAATNAYIIAYDNDGNEMDKAKLELGADTNKTGIYTLKFAVYNFGNTPLSYDVSAYVMTEGVNETKTNNGETTVTEEAYILDGAKMTIVSSNLSGNTVTVGAGQKQDITVTLTLSDEDKAYLDSSFENGMYVEGFVCLDAKEENSVDLSVPYLTFYGDWTAAPLFDLDYFQTNKDELDDSISLLDKTLPDAYATRPIGGLTSDYMSYLGSYYFVQNPNSTPIAADRKYISLSNQPDTINSLRYVWAGMLRNASKVDVTITDDSTGEIVYQTTDNDIRKSYGDGGEIRPAAIDIEFSAIEQKLKNNTSYTVKLKGYLDDGDDDYTDNENGENTNLNNTFEFPLVADFQPPTLTDCEFYTEYDKANKKTKLFAKLAVYDNHYAMALQVGYVTVGEEGFVLKNFDRYLTPVYSQEDSTTYVIYELTDYINEIKKSYNKNSFTVACYDYALNQATYEIALPDEFTDLYFEKDEVTLSPNEVYDLRPLVYPNTEWPELVEYTVSVPTSGEVARVVNNKLIAIAPGTCQVYATVIDPNTNKPKQAKFTLTVLGPDDPGYKKYDKTVTDDFALTGYYVNKAFYMVSTEDRLIGSTGDEMKFVGKDYSLELYPSESVTLRYRLNMFYPDETEVAFISSNEKIVKVDENGQITAVSEGFASISVNVIFGGKSSFYSQSISIEVKDGFINSGPTLTHYYGSGNENHVVEFPEDLAIKEIGQFAFSNYDYVEKDLSMGDVINDDYPDLLKIWFIGDDTIEKVIIPEGVEKIGSYAFANMTALKEVVLPSTLKIIDQGAFYGCTSLTTISSVTGKDKGLSHVQLINQSAFQNTSLRGRYELDSIVAIASYAFMGNERMEEIVLGENAVSVGNYAFAANASLESITFNSSKVKLGAGAFSGCESLTEMRINTEVIPTSLFEGAASLRKVTFGPSVEVISENAFKGTKVDTVIIEEGNTAFKVYDNYVLNAAGDTLALVFPSVSGTFTLDNPNVTTIGTGAFAGNLNIRQVNIPSVKYVENYAFAGCEKLNTINLGVLERIGDFAFFDTIINTLPSFDKIDRIGSYAFAQTRIKSVVIPDGMVIGRGAFSECLTLASVTIGDNVEIGNRAFFLNLTDNWTSVRGDDGYFRYDFHSPLKSVTIGKNAKIGSEAFSGAFDITSVTLGEGATIGSRAFFNTYKLTSIDLSKVTSIGSEAFSGDTYNVFKDASCSIILLDDEGYEVLAYYGSKFEEIDLTSATQIGDAAFAGCTELKKVTLGESISRIPARAFLECQALESINLGGVKTIGDSAFVNTALTTVTLNSITSIDKYAFSENDKLTSVIFGENSISIGEGAFSNCEALTTVENISKAVSIGDYAFAYTAISSVDLSGAEHIGTQAFLKESLTDFAVTLGEGLKSVGDNPFAYCNIKAFHRDDDVEFNGTIHKIPVYNYNISDSVIVIDGSLYAKLPYGYELICHAGEGSSATVAEGTVRISAYAFAGSTIQSVTLPHSLNSIGHKAFYDCKSLTSVAFRSYDAPILEEEYDEEYFYSYDNIPGTGVFTLSATEKKDGLGVAPFFMWNAADLANNCFFGANFVNYIGHTDNNIVMIRPSNGLHYETFIFEQYFNENIVDGKAATDDFTQSVIDAINAFPKVVELSDENIVVAARALYDEIATIEQRALVYNYTMLTDAERRIADLKYIQESESNPSTPDDGTDSENPEENTETPTEGNPAQGEPNMVAIIITSVTIGAILILAVIFVIICIIKMKKSKVTPPDTDNTPDGTDTNCGDNLTDASEDASNETAASEAIEQPENGSADEAESVDTDNDNSAEQAELSEETSGNGDDTNEENN